MFSLLAGRRAARAQSDAMSHAARILADAQRVLVITGAGMSADSGLPTYRGIGGLYEEAATADGITIEQALSGAMFERDPGLTWRYIDQVERACRGAQPNAGHQVLADWARRYTRMCVVTQNVDGFHGQAGSPEVIEMHGDIHRLQCMDCHQQTEVDNYAAFEQIPPRCAVCNGMLRPRVVLFGELLPQKAITRYERALAAGFDTMLVIGTSAICPYIAAPVRQARHRGTAAIEINPQATEISRFCDVAIRDNAAAVLTELQRRIR